MLAITSTEANRLMETDGIELRGSARIVAYGASTCHVLEANHTADEYVRLKGNDGKQLDVWQLEFAVYNGSGKQLDHLLARYSIDSSWPPCTNWSEPTGKYAEALNFSDVIGHIQRSDKPYAVDAGETLSKSRFFIVFSDDAASRFAKWSEVVQVEHVKGESTFQHLVERSREYSSHPMVQYRAHPIG